jgi:hypothetical protein
MIACEEGLGKVLSFHRTSEADHGTKTMLSASGSRIQPCAVCPDRFGCAWFSLGGALEKRCKSMKSIFDADDDGENLKLGGSWVNPVKLDDAFWKIQLCVAASHTGHVVVYNRTKFFASLVFESASRFAFVGDELASEHALATERILVASRDG